MTKIRVGYIVDQGAVSHLVWDLIERSKSAQHYSIELLVVQNVASREMGGMLAKLIDFIKKRGIKKLVEKALFSVIERIERKFVGRLTPKLAVYFRRYRLDQTGIAQLQVHPQVSASGFVYRYADADLAAIRERQIDVLIRGGNGILRGGILDVCRFGILSFHHANNAVNRGAPPGFWEVYGREPSSGFIIQQMQSELDGGDVLYKGAVATSWFYVLNRTRVYAKANHFMHRLLERTGQMDSLPPAYPKTPYAFPLYLAPALGQQLAYLAKTASHLGGKVAQRLLGTSMRWSVAYQFVDNWKDAVLWRSTVIRNPPQHFLADPFVVQREGRHVCYVEDYDYVRRKGTITAYELRRDGYTSLGTVLDEDCHLSYPFLLEEGGHLYMCPETQGAREIRMYKCIDFPLRWELHRVLMRGVSAVDSSIFKVGERWWMLSNLDSAGSGDHGSELHLFHADAFDADNWTAHPHNPIVFDSQRARNGGLIQDGEEIYRVFQTQGFDQYGASMGVARITELNEMAYSEELLFAIPPKFFAGLQGTHTYSFGSGVLALDFVRLERHGK
ncbi:MAG: hypothetical protein V4463_05910 [Pseudomonadota bacterium]